MDCATGKRSRLNVKVRLPPHSTQQTYMSVHYLYCMLFCLFAVAVLKSPLIVCTIQVVAVHVDCAAVGDTWQGSISQGERDKAVEGMRSSVEAFGFSFLNVPLESIFMPVFKTIDNTLTADENKLKLVALFSSLTSVDAKQDMLKCLQYVLNLQRYS
jgi:hypothetical protein